jgi:hypothetical protein
MVREMTNEVHDLRSSPAARFLRQQLAGLESKEVYDIPRFTCSRSYSISQLFFQ